MTDPESALAGPRPLRSDAQRNRQRILAAAVDAFAEFGTDAAMEEIASRAEVGVGTIYRAFGSKIDLVREVYLLRVEELRAATAAAAQIPDPAPALLGYLTATVDFYHGNRLFSALRQQMGLSADWVRDVHNQRLADVAAILDRARAAELIHPELTVTDFEFALRSAAQLGHGAGELGRSMCWRMVHLLLLAAPTPLPPLPTPAPPIPEREYADFVSSTMTVPPSG